MINNLTEWRLYPIPSKSYSYVHGDEVFIRPKSNNEIGKRGIVIVNYNDTTTDDKSNLQHDNERNKSNDNRVCVEIIPSCFYEGEAEDNKIEMNSNAHNNCNNLNRLNWFKTTFRHNRLIRRFRSVNAEAAQSNNHKCTILLTETTNYFRHLAASQLNHNDSVLEIGCSNGECSLIINKYCGNYVGYDTSTQMIVEAKEKLNQFRRKSDSTTTCTGSKKCEFHTIDPFIDPKKASELAKGSNVVFIDIGGNRELSGVLGMIEWSREHLLSSSSLDLIVIKSEELFKAIKESAPSSKTCSIHESDVNQLDSSDVQPRKKLKHNQNDVANINIDEMTGLIHNCEQWYHVKLHECCHNRKEASIVAGSGGPPKYTHPLKAPMAICPIDGITPICRYKNYHEGGCKKDDCTFDHLHCHWCLQQGHHALNCTFVRKS